LRKHSGTARVSATLARSVLVIERYSRDQRRHLASC